MHYGIFSMLIFKSIKFRLEIIFSVAYVIIKPYTQRHKNGSSPC